MPPKNKLRLDELLVRKELFPTRSQAQREILAGNIFVDGQKITKAGTLVKADAKVEVKTKSCPYVGRGGLKLAAAISAFKPSVAGKICLDIGASTGGFTDCLLQNGAQTVIAVDCGRGQLAWKLRTDPRVICLEKTNARYLTRSLLEEKVETLLQKKVKAQLKKQKAQFQSALPSDWIDQLELAVIDVSFISLDLILPPTARLLIPDGQIIALIKPQFEAGKGQVGSGGLIKNPEIHLEVLRKILKLAEKLDLQTRNLISSPVTGADGNIEYLIYLTKGEGKSRICPDDLPELVRKTWQKLGDK